MTRKRSIHSGGDRRHQARDRAGQHVVVFGAGGNIGSHLVPLLARMSGVARLTLVDADHYEAKNIQSQDIQPSDIGRPKAEVQARRARRLNPRLAVVAIADRIENVPLGRLRGHVILACLDSKESRRFANEIAWRLGVPLIDAGVEASALLARVNVYLPALNAPCLECFWDERDYAQLATRHPCQPEEPKAPPTNAPACLGSLAAALQAIECQKLLAGQSATAAIGQEVLINAATHKYFLTALRRNPNCRFDHRIWKISTLQAGPSDLSLGAALRLGKHNGSASLAFGGRAIVERIDCPGCGFTRKVFQLNGRIRPSDRFCGRCNRQLLAAGFNMRAYVSAGALSARDAGRSLASLGLRGGDELGESGGKS
jgi:molybdopterin/thiamine biosynthesis adenylyltransferase